jgi:hypothetical protein
MRLVVGRGRGARYPIQFLDEVRAGIDGPWSAVWRAVLAEGELPVARWFVALAVYDTIHADAAGREWIEVVARIKTAKIINTIVEKMRAAMGPGVARSEDRTRKVRVA